jgi:EmrB/QacA subfamily drug resistance transporter
MTTNQAAAESLSHRRKQMILLLTCLGQFMVVLDIAIVTVALPAMKHSLDFSATGLQWVVNAYTLTYAGFLLLGGRAADMFGRRRIFLLGLTVFTIASLVCGLAWSPASMVTARAIQGMGGAILSPATLTILIVTFTDARERAHALGIWSAALACGGATGALAGGFLTDYIDWRWIFLINVPIGIVGFVIGQRVLRESKAEGASRSLDVAGAVTITAGLTALVYAVVQTNSHAWGSVATIVPLALAALLIGAFVIIELRATAPLVPFATFKSRALSGANFVMLMIGASMFAMWYFVSLYLQEVLHYSPMQAGLCFFPAAIAVVIGAQISGRIVGKFGPRIIMATSTVVVGLALLWMSRTTATSSYLSGIFGPITIAALGLGFSFPAGTFAATAGVAPRNAGLASGLVNANRQLGGAIGLAVLATIAEQYTTSLLPSTPLPEAITSGYTLAFIIGGVFAFIAAAGSFIVPAHIKSAQPHAVVVQASD